MAVCTVNVLSLCSGVGGLDLGIRLAIPAARTVCFVEYEAFAAEVLVSRMEDGDLDEAPLWSDLRTFDGKPWRGVVDLVSGGYPCQPFSAAGKRRGEDDPRHLWPSVRRIVEEVRPRWVFFENVPGHISLGLDVVIADLEGLKYRVEVGIFSAEEVGAPHRRERLFIFGQLADPPNVGHEWPRTTRHGWPRPENVCGVMGDTDDTRLEGRREPIGERADEQPPWAPGPTDDAGWRYVIERWPHLAPAVESQIFRVANGLAGRMDDTRIAELRAIGNGVVPVCAALAFAVLAHRMREALAPATSALTDIA